MSETQKVHDLPVDVAQRPDPYPLFDRIREEGVVQRVELHGGVRVWMVTGYQEAVEALGDTRLSSSPLHLAELREEMETQDRSNVLMGSMLVADPPDHARLRGLVSKIFTYRRVAELTPNIQKHTDLLLDEIAPIGRADLVESLALPLPINVLGDLIGIPEDHRPDFAKLAVALIMPPNAEERLERGKRAREELAEYFGGLLAERRARRRGDVLTSLVDAHGAGRLDDREVVAMAILLTIAGHETTASVIANGLHALLRHPAELARLRADRTLLPAAVEELLRYEGPVSRGVARFSLEEIELAGTRIPAGEMVVIGLAAANRDPRRFDRPELLDIDRQDPPQQLAFGHGIHFCLGAPLARAETAVALGAVLDRLPDLAAADPDVVPPRRAGILRGVASLPVTFTPSAI